MDANDFFELASRLAIRPSESERRTAVGRAYYAAFHVAHDLVDAQFGVVVPINQAHNKLAFCLQNVTSSEKLSDAGRFLLSLRDARVIADYRLNDLLPSNDDWAKLQVEIAHDVIKAIAACAQEQDVSMVRNEVREYARTTLRCQLRDLQQ
jgi:hypothetical protein